MLVAEEIAKSVTKWPRGYAYLADELKRAVAGAVLTLAEGNGKRSSHAERRRFFEMSMGSISETMSGLDLAKTFHLMHNTEALKSRLKLAYVKISALP